MTVTLAITAKGRDVIADALDDYLCDCGLQIEGGTWAARGPAGRVELVRLAEIMPAVVELLDAMSWWNGEDGADECTVPSSPLLAEVLRAERARYVRLLADAEPDDDEGRDICSGVLTAIDSVLAQLDASEVTA